MRCEAGGADWRRVPLGSVATVERAGVSPARIAEGTRYVGLEHIQPDGSVDEAPDVSPGDLASTKFRFTVEHLLYGKLRPYLRKVARPKFGGVCSTDILPIRPGPDLDRDYLFHCLRQPSLVDLVNSRTPGANLPRIAPGKLAAIRIPLPPLPEQRRIATILDKADAIRRKRQESLALLDELLRSTFLEMFGDPVRNERGWAVVRLGEVAKVRRGSSPRPIHDFMGGTIPWIKIGDATAAPGMYIDHTAEFVTAAGAEKSVLLEPEAVVIANSGVSLGFARILKIRGCIHDGWLAVEDLDSSVNRFFFVALVNVITDRLRKSAPAGTQPNLNIGLVRDLRIPRPPLELQERLAAVIDTHAGVRVALGRSSLRADGFFRSLSQRAFQGQL